MATDPPARECRSSYYTDTGRRQHHGDREVRCGKPTGHVGAHVEFDEDGAEIVAWLPPVAAPAGTGSPTPAEPWDAVQVACALAELDRLAADRDAARAELSQVRDALTNARAVASDRLADRDKIARDLISERDEARSALAALREQIGNALDIAPDPDTDLPQIVANVVKSRSKAWQDCKRLSAALAALRAEVGKIDDELNSHLQRMADSGMTCVAAIDARDALRALVTDQSPAAPVIEGPTVAEAGAEAITHRSDHGR